MGVGGGGEKRKAGREGLGKLWAGVETVWDYSALSADEERFLRLPVGRARMVFARLL